MKNYIIISLEDKSECTNLVIICDANSPYEYMNLIYNELKEMKVNGKILIDQILHVGNTEKRFISFNYTGSDTEKLSYEYVSKDSICRKISCKFLKDENLIDSSILSSIQKRMIKKGISI